MTTLIRTFDGRALLNQLSDEPPPVASAVVRPADGREPGTSSRFAANRVIAPGALVMTRLTVRDADESATIDELSVEVSKALSSSRGFLGTLTADVGTEKFTVSAFASVDAMRAVHTRSHQRAVRRFFQGGVSTRALISAWTPVSVREYARCPACATVRHLTDEASCTCDCGESLSMSPLI